VKAARQGKRIRIFVGEGDRLRGQPLYTVIVEELRRAGIAGATVFKGIEGYGAHATVHVARVFDLSTNLPVVIEAVDTEEALLAVLPAVRDMVSGGTITLESVEIIAPAGKNGEPSTREENS
jgi:PII-like signaling protein